LAISSFQTGQDEQDFSQAAQWYKGGSRQGEAGSPIALFSLARMHEAGHGVKADETVAVHYIAVPAKLGHLEARAALERLGAVSVEN